MLSSFSRFAAVVGISLVIAQISMASSAGDLAGAPSIKINGSVSQLTVDGQPFLILGGELGNSSSSSLVYMQPIWGRLAAMHLNTVLAGVSWESIEPEEGQFDFTLVDGLIRDARAHQLRLVFLWFASWKNGMSSYPPVWVKRDVQRFPRAQIAGSTADGVLSVFAPANVEADANAFSALLKHVREFDRPQHTVLMVQVENEVGILNDSRDRSPAAEKFFNQPVPTEFTQYLATHGNALAPELKTLWEAAGRKPLGTWPEMFGPSPATDEIFMAWYYARYVNQVAAAGKKAYPIPLYANAWLNEHDAHPGNYPSGGPLAHVLDAWKAAAPSLDLLAPDLYASNYEERCQKFTRAGNLLFIPEMQSGPEGARNVFIAVGGFAALGVSPFGIDFFAFRSAEHPEDFMNHHLSIGESYEVLGQLAPLILKQQALGNVMGFALDKDHSTVTSRLNGYDVVVTLDELFGRHATEGAGIIIATGPDQFVGGGAGFRVAFHPTTPGPALAGIGTVDEGVYENGQWVPGRRLNGDETDQGRGWRFSSFKATVSHCLVYRHD